MQKRMWEPRTKIEIDGDYWLINGRPTYMARRYQGISIEGLLLNSRMANGIFDDANSFTRHLWAYPDTGFWDASRNTNELAQMLPVYASHGLTAICINMQGGSPLGYYRETPSVLNELRKRIHARHPSAKDNEVWYGVPDVSSQPWQSSGFDSLGQINPEFRGRTGQLIEAADAAGLIVCLGLFYFGQDERLLNERAVCSAVREICRWILAKGYQNVIIEINNEADVPRYQHKIMQPHRVHELIFEAKSIQQKSDRLLVGTSSTRRQVPSSKVVEVSDFILLHGNGVDRPKNIMQMVERVRSVPSYQNQPILFNEDDHFDFGKPNYNFRAALEARAGWGYFDPGDAAGGQIFYGDYINGYQNPPINWSINTPRKRGFFNILASITGSSGRTNPQ